MSIINLQDRKSAMDTLTRIKGSKHTSKEAKSRATELLAIIGEMNKLDVLK